MPKEKEFKAAWAPSVAGPWNPVLSVTEVMLGFFCEEQQCVSLGFLSCHEISELMNLEGGKVYFGSQFLELELHDPMQLLLRPLEVIVRIRLLPS